MDDIKAPTTQGPVETGGTAATVALNENLVPYTPLQLLNINRLRELLERQGNAGRAEPWIKKALSKAVYSVFLDCVMAGTEKEARELIGQKVPEKAQAQS
ncbi:MAG: hypothetical protein EXR67_02740 [Dehalococcoidia bacterium]|nr:hypothetical protein [Dehalococcoidia bacterium]